MPGNRPQRPTIEQVLLATDWQRLREQKAALLARITRLSLLGDPAHDDIDGIVNFLDAVMDAAAEVVGPVVVFGPVDPEDALVEIHALLDGTAWDADTLDAIANVVRACGFDLGMPNGATYVPGPPHGHRR